MHRGAGPVYYDGPVSCEEVKMTQPKGSESVAKVSTPTKPLQKQNIDYPSSAKVTSDEVKVPAHLLAAIANASQSPRRIGS